VNEGLVSDGRMESRLPSSSYQLFRHLWERIDYEGEIDIPRRLVANQAGKDFGLLPPQFPQPHANAKAIWDMMSGTIHRKLIGFRVEGSSLLLLR
jgi:hypothetical protein